MRHPLSPERLEIERYRYRGPVLGSTAQHGNNGVFVLPTGTNDRAQFKCIVSDEAGWEHVSVVVVTADGKEHTPTWEQMCAVKATFWRPDECVVQYHPAAAEYVNVHPYCLHLWKPLIGRLQTPPRWMIG